MMCPECRTENPEGGTRCSACGAALTAPPAQRQYKSSASLVRREIGVLIVGLVAILVALFGAWYVLVQYRSPETIVRRFIDADIHGRYAEQNRYVINGWSASLTLSVFQEIRRQLGRSPFESYRVVSSSVHGNSASIDVEVPAPAFGSRPVLPGAPSGTTVDITFSLERRGDDWLIEPQATAASAATAFAALGWRAAGFNLPGGLTLPPLPNQTGSPYGAHTHP